MGKIRKQYTGEFKIEAVKLSYSSDEAVEITAANLGISKSSLQRWRQEYSEDPAQAFPGQGQRKGRDEEVARLKRELAVAQQERDILKKALAIFTQGRK